jgi:ribosomal protein S18 acetylase RimI-like enzyme
MNRPEFSCSLFETKDLEEMADVLAESFSLGESMAVAIRLSKEDIWEIVKIFGPKAAAEKVTVIARSSTGQMVGALLVQDFATGPPEGMNRIAPAFNPIGALLDGLDESYRQAKKIQPGNFLHLFMLGVPAAFQGKKIGQALVAECLMNGRQRGYRMAVTEATGNASQHIFRRLGFVERLAAKYADFEFEGRRVFASIEGTAGALLMDKQLD